MELHLMCAVTQWPLIINEKKKCYHHFREQLKRFCNGQILENVAVSMQHPTIECVEFYFIYLFFFVYGWPTQTCLSHLLLLLPKAWGLAL